MTVSAVGEAEALGSASPQMTTPPSRSHQPTTMIVRVLLICLQWLREDDRFMRPSSNSTAVAAVTWLTGVQIRPIPPA